MSRSIHGFKDLLVTGVGPVGSKRVGGSRSIQEHIEGYMMVQEGPEGHGFKDLLVTGVFRWVLVYWVGF